MSGNLTPLTPASANGLGHIEPAPVESWGPAAPPAAPAGGSQQWSRYISALKRYKWLMLFVVFAGTALGLVATRFIKPEYVVNARIWIASGSPMGNDDDDGPVTANAVLAQSAWAEFLRTGRVSEPVVSALSLYLDYENPADSAVFSGFTVTPALKPGAYTLEVDDAGKKYTLTTDDDQVVESGFVGNPIGAKLGFNWQPARETLGRSRTISFTVVTPREAAVELISRLTATVPPGTNFLTLTLTGDEPHRTAATMNALTQQFVDVAAELKRSSLTAFANTLDSQLAYAEKALKESEESLQRYRVNTATLPTESSPAAGGILRTEPQVYTNFFQQKAEYDNILRDRQAIERYTAAARRGEVDPSAIMAVPTVQLNPGAANLRTAIQELYTVEAQIRTQKQFYTSEHQGVKELEARANQIRTQTIPQAAGAVVSTLKLRENDLKEQVGAASRDLRNVPTRSIEEARLQRQMDQNVRLYTSLKARYEDAKLAEASAMPDISILDSAVAPLRPQNNTAPRIVLIALAASIGAAVLLALLLDQFDRRFRYPEQVSRELGLDIIGAVPALRRTRNGELNPEEASQVVESFRSIRLNLRHAFPGRGPVIFTVSSPGAGDGKSLVASNLAMSFAEAGYRTLLIDGDIRRGALHTAFEVEQRPGLLDYLAGEVPRGEILKPSAYESLTVIPCGTRRRRGPELLSAPGMTELLADARTKFDAIIVDSAPLGAGVDAYALGAATANMLLVFRTGATDRKLAQAKLAVLDRLPVRLLGAVLNSIQAEGAYQYYQYIYGYSADEERPQLQLTSQVGTVTSNR
jgi:polysaccharide biosynthesis transport protein